MRKKTRTKYTIKLESINKKKLIKTTHKTCMDMAMITKNRIVRYLDKSKGKNKETKKEELKKGSDKQTA